MITVKDRKPLTFSFKAGDNKRELKDKKGHRETNTLTMEQMKINNSEASPIYHFENVIYQTNEKMLIYQNKVFKPMRKRYLLKNI